MRLTHLLLAACLLFSFFQNAFGQCPPAGNLVFSSQAELDKFGQDYPDCTVIEGDVKIQGASISSLAPLSKIQKINGNLLLTTCPSLTNLTGLGVLRTVSGSFEIYSNINLQSLAGMENLERIGGNFAVAGNSKLQDLGNLNKFEELDGHLSIAGNPMVTSLSALDALKYIGGDFLFGSDVLTEINGCNNIAFVLGSFRISNCSVTKISGFQNLASIGKDFSLISNLKLTTISGFSKLSEIGEDFDLTNNATLSNISGLMALTSVEGTFTCQNSGFVQFEGFQNLKNIGGFLKFGGHLKMTSFKGFQGLEVLFSDLLFQSNDVLKTFEGFQKLAQINGNLTISVNINLQAITGFDQLKTIGGNFAISDFSNLQSLVGFTNLTQVGNDFIISGNSRLAMLPGDQSLEIVGGKMILYNNFFGSLPAFQKLFSIGSDLDIRNNLQLTNLDFLKELNSVLGKIYLQNNSKLDNCSVFAVCQKLTSNAKDLSISGSYPNGGCADTTKIAINCGQIAHAAGKMHLDFDCNGTLDGNDTPIKNRLLKKDNDQPFALSNGAGNYAGVLKQGILTTIKPVEIQGFKFSPLQYEVKAQTLTQAFPNQDFAFCPDGTFTNFCVSISASNLPRPGFSVEYTVEVLNLGNTFEGYNLRFDLPNASLAGFYEITEMPAAATADADKIEWTGSPLAPFDSEKFTIKILFDPTTPLGTPFTFQSVVIPESGVDHDISNNIFPLRQETVGSFDPNDKTVNLPEITLVETFKTFDLAYQIRFQNTGTFPATFIEVLDTLPAALDLHHFEMLQASHDYRLTFLDGNVLKWRFDDINLPDSASNEPESHGYILFKIRTRGNHFVGEQIHNRCGIYFDFNKPVITNFAETIFEAFVGSKTPASDAFGLSSVLPNPTGGAAEVFLTRPPADFLAQLIDLQGVVRFERRFNGARSFVLPAADLPAGFYFLKIESGASVIFRRVVKN